MKPNLVAALALCFGLSMFYLWFCFSLWFCSVLGEKPSIHSIRQNEHLGRGGFQMYMGFVSWFSLVLVWLYGLVWICCAAGFMVWFRKICFSTSCQFFDFLRFLVSCFWFKNEPFQLLCNFMIFFAFWFLVLVKNEPLRLLCTPSPDWRQCSDRNQWETESIVNTDWSIDWW